MIENFGQVTLIENATESELAKIAAERNLDPTIFEKINSATNVARFLKIESNTFASPHLLVTFDLHDTHDQIETELDDTVFGRSFFILGIETHRAARYNGSIGRNDRTEIRITVNAVYKHCGTAINIRHTEIFGRAAAVVGEQTAGRICRIGLVSSRADSKIFVIADSLPIRRDRYRARRFRAVRQYLARSVIIPTRRVAVLVSD